MPTKAPPRAPRKKRKKKPETILSATAGLAVGGALDVAPTSLAKVVAPKQSAQPTVGHAIRGDGTNSAVTPESLKRHDADAFDYTVLEGKTRTMVKRKTHEIHERIRSTAQSIVEIGQRLSDVKRVLPHGTYLAWLDAEFPWRQTTALRMMDVAKAFKSAKLADLPIDVSALYLLAAPSMPAKVREEFVTKAEAGTPVTHAEVKAALANHKSGRAVVKEGPELPVEKCITPPGIAGELGIAAPVNIVLAAAEPIAKVAALEHQDGTEEPAVIGPSVPITPATTAATAPVGEYLPSEPDNSGVASDPRPQGTAPAERMAPPTSAQVQCSTKQPANVPILETTLRLCHAFDRAAGARY